MLTTDGDVPAFLAELGLDGLIDLHTHFMPQRVLAKVWAYFDQIRFEDGSGWPITYRVSDEERVAVLRDMNVVGFTALAYAHRPRMAAWLNEWTLGFAQHVPACIPSATFYPEPEVDDYVAAAIAAGAKVFKVHLRVGAFDPRQTVLQPVWACLAERRIPVVIHTGSGPESGPFTGPRIFADLMAAHPDLTAIVAHMGSPEHEEYLAIAQDFESVYLDTTMAFTDFFDRFAQYSSSYLERVARAGDRIVFGSDFPNIPHPYAHQLQALVRLEFGDAWLRSVCHDNARRILDRAQTGAGKSQA